MSTNRERMEFAAALARNRPSDNAVAVVSLCRDLMRYGATLRRLAKKQCNDATWGPADEARERRLLLVVARNVTPWRLIHQGDPRGYTLRIVLPNGERNTMHDEGWGVPGS